MFSAFCTTFKMVSLSTSSQMPLAARKVVVIGAGVAGLAFVVSLRSIWKEDFGQFPNITQYEREVEEADLSRTGYSLSLRSDKRSQGLQALQQMGILDDLLGISITREGCERGYFGLWSLGWRRLVKIRDEAPNGIPVPGMRVTRKGLRDVLLASAQKDARIFWGVSCTAIGPADDNGIKFRLSDGSEDSCDFLVAADGASSKLRACIRPDDKLNFAGVVSISAVSRFPGSPPEPTGRDWGIIPSAQGVALFASPMEDKCANWSLSYKTDTPRREERQCLPAGPAYSLLQEVKSRGAMFKEPFQTLLAHSDPATLTVINAMDKDPFPHGPASLVPHGVVFIGDSNHAVNTFAGNGANLALKDGFDLATCLCTYTSVERAVKVYDSLSMPRAFISVRKSHVSIKVVHSSGLSWIIYRSMLLILASIVSMWYLCKDTMLAMGGCIAGLGSNRTLFETGLVRDHAPERRR